MRFIPLEAQQYSEDKGLAKVIICFRPDHPKHIGSTKGTAPLGRGLVRTVSTTRSRWPGLSQM